MGRKATKAAGNVWYQARIQAAKDNPLLSSRSGAAEVLQMSEDAVRDAELDGNKVMPVEKANQMANLYKAPELKNWYCLNICPMGARLPLSDRAERMERVTVKLLRDLRTEKVDRMKEQLVEISAKDEFGTEEQKKLKEILDYMNELSTTLSELRTIGERVLVYGKRTAESALQDAG